VSYGLRVSGFALCVTSPLFLWLFQWDEWETRLVQHSVPVFMRTLLDISNDINFHLSKLRELSAEVVSVHTTPNDSSDFTRSDSPLPPLRKRRTRLELKLLIEAVVDTFGGETTDKLIAEKCGISTAMIYREPYATYLTEAKREYKKKQNAKRTADFKKTKYKDELTAGQLYD
jgi:hypothetical protein